MIFLLSIAYLVFMLIIVIREIIYIKRCNDIKIISATRLMYALIYGFVPFLVLYSYSSSGITTYGIDYSSKGVVITTFLLFASVFSYLLLELGYRATIRREYDYYKRTADDNVLPFSEEESLNENTSHYIGFAIALTIISALSLYLWTRAYGGPTKMMVHAQALRSGFTSVSNSLAFFKRFANVSTISSYLAFAILIDKNAKPSNRFISLVLLGTSIYVKVMYSLIDDGRMGAGIFVVGFPAIIIYKNLLLKKTSLGKVARLGGIVLVIGYLLIIFSNPLMDYIRTGTYSMNIEDYDIFASFREEFGYTFHSSQTAMELRYNGFDYTYFQDIASGFFSIFPTSLTPKFARTTLTYINSVNLYGAHVQYGSPPDFLSAAIYDLGYFGLIVFPFLLGVLLHKIDVFFEEYKRKSVWGLVLYICLAFRLARIMANAAMYNVVLSVFYLLFSAALLVLFKKFTIRRWD